MAELLYETSKPEVDLHNITSVFQRDVSLSYKLLRYANSPIFKRRNEVSSIKQALVILGSAELKRFIGLMFANNVNPNKPTELITAAMTRARFCEVLTQNSHTSVDASIAFLTGLLSLIDAILDEKLENIFAKLPLAQTIKESLLFKKGEMATLINLVELIEHADWQNSNTVINTLGLDKEKVAQYYSDALIWADEQVKLTG
jgi:EAL and modified HD-GYP domain-containing signal transduction protein